MIADLAELRRDHGALHADEARAFERAVAASRVLITDRLKFATDKESFERAYTRCAEAIELLAGPDAAKSFPALQGLKPWPELAAHPAARIYTASTSHPAADEGREDGDN
jgi:hypothetical protein